MSKRLSFLLLVLVAATPSAHSGETGISDGDRTFVVYWENDIFARADRYYTNGAKLVYISGEIEKDGPANGSTSWFVNAIDAVPVHETEDSVKNFALSLGQKIYTPDDIEKEDLVEDDRPYAGYTFFGIGVIGRTGKRLDSFELNIGLIGPESYARNIQETVHEWVNTDEPKGWSNQLKNEPTLVLAYEIKYRPWQTRFGGWSEVDVIPSVGAALGNVYTYLNCGAEIRFGCNLPADFGTGLVRPAISLNTFTPGAKNGRFGFHVFAGIDGRAVLQNIFLDGNTFTDSHEVDKKTFVADIMVGASLGFEQFRLTYTHVFRTKEFDEQDKNQFFGSISLAYMF